MSNPGFQAEWQKMPIKNIYLGMYDGVHGTPPPSQDGPVFLGIKNLTDDGKFDFSDIRHISEEDFARWTKRILPKEGDIVFTYEATLHRYAIIPRGFRGCLGRRLALIKPDNKKIITKYLFYYFFSEEWRNTINKNIFSGATVDRIPIIRFPNFEITVPPLPTQQKIAAILSAYDDLIENNTRRIKILEEMAQAIYREWFVNFRFPGHEGVRMVESELGSVPEGWEVVRLDSVADVNMNSIKRGQEPERIGYIDISSVSTGVINKIEWINFSDSPGRARRIVRHGDLIWSMVRPNRRSYCLILNPQTNTIVSTGFAVIQGTKIPYSYLYSFLTSNNFVSYLINHATGAAYPAVKTDDFKNAQILKPDDPLLKKFHEIAEPIYEIKNYLSQKNTYLRRTRDLLLPKLISGELDVSGLDIEIPAAL